MILREMASDLLSCGHVRGHIRPPPPAFFRVKKLYFQMICLVTSIVFTTLTVASVLFSSSIYDIGGDPACLLFWFAGSFFVGHQIISGFGIAVFR